MTRKRRGAIRTKYLYVTTICDDPHGRLWRAGRLCVIRFLWMVAQFEWSVGSGLWPALLVTIGGEDRTIGWRVSAFRVSLFGRVRLLPAKWHYRLWPKPRTTGIELDGLGRVGVLKVWHRERNGWTRGERIWTECSILPYRRIVNGLLGRVEVHKELLGEHRTVVPMPEGSYPATVKLERWTWKRPRSPRAKHRFMSDVKPDTPVPVPGKGENSWDCDDDAVCSSGGSATTVHAAVTAFVGSVLRSRERHGGSIEWQPRPKKEQAR